MILNPPSIAYTGLALLGLLLGLALLILVIRTLRWGEGRESDSGLVLALLIGQTLLIVRLASWPTLYWVMGSYIPLIPGAMCLYGVAQNPRSLTLALELLEPLALLIAGATFIIVSSFRNELESETSVSTRTILKHLGAAALVGILVSSLGLAYMVAEKNTQAVSCCSSAFGTADRLGHRITDLLPSPVAAQFLLPINQSLALALGAFQVFFLVRPKRNLGFLLAGLSLVHSGFTLLNLFETLAPVLNGMPGHYCAYCIANPALTPPLITTLALAFLGLSGFIPLWQSWAHRLGANDWPRLSWTLLSLASLIGFWSLILIPYYRSNSFP